MLAGTANMAMCLIKHFERERARERARARERLVQSEKCSPISVFCVRRITSGLNNPISAPIPNIAWFRQLLTGVCTDR